MRNITPESKSELQQMSSSVYPFNKYKLTHNGQAPFQVLKENVLSENVTNPAFTEFLVEWRKPKANVTIRHLSSGER